MSFLDLATNENEIKGVSEGFSDYQWQQVSATRDITGTNFPNGLIRFKFDIDATRRWIPQEAYIRSRISITKVGGAQLELSDDVAPNMGFMASLFQNGEFRYNNMAISRLSDYVPEVNALAQRSTLSKSHNDSIGGMNMWESDYYVRANRVARLGFDQDQWVKTYDFLDILTTGNTLAVTAASNTLTFAIGTGTAIPDLRKYFSVGDTISVTHTAGTYSGTIETVAAAAVTGPAVGADAGATAITALTYTSVGGGMHRLPRVSKRDGAIEFIWRPPLSVFGYEKALPIGKYELQLNPQTSSVYKNLIVESLLANKTGGTDYDVSIIDMYLYIPTVKAKRFGTGRFFIDLTEITCQKDTITGGATSLTHSRFTIPKSTFALTAAFQDSRTSTSTLYSTTKFKMGTSNTELGLNRFHIHYAGKTRPSPDADPAYKKSGSAAPEDYTTEMYYRTAASVGALSDTGGGETVREWQDRGAYYHYFWPKDGSNSDTEVRVHYQFPSAVSNADCLLFAWAKKIVEVNVADDNIVSVNVSEG